MYESGAILGRARRNKLAILEKMITRPEAVEGESIKMLEKLAKERLAAFRQEVGKEPDTFFEFVQQRELQEATGISLSGSVEAYIAGNKKIRKEFDKKISLESAEAMIKMFGLQGIGFGGFFPELTERMYKNVYEHIDSEIWSEAREAGLGIPESPTVDSLEDREEAVLQMVAAYASEYYPELLEPLNLQ
jgi:hypothetical protein